MYADELSSSKITHNANFREIVAKTSVLMVVFVVFLFVTPTSGCPQTLRPKIMRKMSFFGKMMGDNEYNYFEIMRKNESS